MTILDDQLDLDLMHSRRAFPVAQALLSGAVLRLAASEASIGWHGTEVSPETGSVALVREDGPFVELVGEIVRLERRVGIHDRAVYAYVYGTGPILDDLSLARRTFMGLGILANENVSASIEVIA